MLLGAPSGFWPWTGLWSTLKKSKSGLNPKRSEISRESSSDPYFITNLNSAWEQGTRRTSRQAQLPKLPEKAVTIRESSGTYFRVPKASWTDHILWGLYVSICGGKQAWGGGVCRYPNALPNTSSIPLGPETSTLYLSWLLRSHCSPERQGTGWYFQEDSAWWLPGWMHLQKQLMSLLGWWALWQQLSWLPHLWTQRL